MNPSKVAIVSAAGVYPDALDLESLWRLVRGGQSASRRVPEGRWLLDPNEIHDSEIQPDKVSSLHGCFVEGFQADLSDLALEGNLVSRLDPAFHLALHTANRAWQGCEHADTDRSRGGIVFGHIALPSDSASNLAREILGQALAEEIGERADFVPATHPLNRYVAGLPAGLVARALGFEGGSFTLDAACASSLYAIKLARDEIFSGRAGVMIAGGLSRPDALYTQMGFTQLRALSKTGRCSPFDTKGDGLVVGEGCGLFVLKRLDDALEAGDRIWATVEGVGLSNDRGGKLLAPDSEGQLRAMRRAYREAGWNPQDIDLIECHATGTPLGDRVEIESLKALWGETDRRAVIGSVKSNVGHMLTAAGAAGVTKVLLAMQHETLPPTANFESAPQDLGLDQSPFEVLREARRWERPSDHPRRAAVSAFGFGGINAHLLLEQYEPEVALGKVFSLGSSSRAGEDPVVITGYAAHFGSWRHVEELFAHGARREGDFSPSPSALRLPWSSGFRPGVGFPADRVDISLGRYRIPPRELSEILPQQAMMLQVTAEALGDASWSFEPRDDVGVYIGTGLDLNTTNFAFRWSILERARAWAKARSVDDEAGIRRWADRLQEAASPPLSAPRTLGALASIAASRIAREFHFGGPSFTVCSEDTSGYQALALACEALERGEIEAAVVGGVELANDARAAAGTVSAHGEGTRIGEGAGALIVERLSSARERGARVRAIVGAIGRAHGDADEALSLAKQRAHAQGPGSPQNAPHELDPEVVQSRIGHCGSASGVLSLLLASQSLERELSLEEGQPWPRHEQARRVAVHGTSVDGNAFHVILEEAPHEDHVLAESPRETTYETMSLPLQGPPIPASARWQAPLVNRAVLEPSAMVASALVDGAMRIESATNQAHQTYLQLAQEGAAAAANNIAFQMRLLESCGGEAPPRPRVFGPGTAIYDDASILEFAVGNPSAAFGEPYRVFDEERVIARLPGPPYKFLNRITEIEAEAWVLQAPARIVAEYDVQPDDWYFGASRQPEMPYAVLLEIALQPCGWLAAFLGTALTSPEDLCFRNLGGKARLMRPVSPDEGTLRIAVTMTKVSQSGGMTIQNFDFQVASGRGTILEGDTYFGFFTRAALANQVGIRETTPINPLDGGDRARREFPFPSQRPFPEPAWRMLETIEVWLPSGGTHGLGLIRGRKPVDPDDWFFAAHFHQDPVWPGSLGLEAFLQLLEFVATERWGSTAGTVFRALDGGEEHRWTYRGQVVPTSKCVRVEADIESVDDRERTLRASGTLSVDGRVIYSIEGFTLKNLPAAATVPIEGS